MTILMENFITIGIRSDINITQKESEKVLGEVYDRVKSMDGHTIKFFLQTEENVKLTPKEEMYDTNGVVVSLFGAEKCQIIEKKMDSSIGLFIVSRWETLEYFGKTLTTMYPELVYKINAFSDDLRFELLSTIVNGYYTSREHRGRR